MVVAMAVPTARSQRPAAAAAAAAAVPVPAAAAAVLVAGSARDECLMMMLMLLVIAVAVAAVAVRVAVRPRHAVGVRVAAAAAAAVRVPRRLALACLQIHSRCRQRLCGRRMRVAVAVPAAAGPRRCCCCCLPLLGLLAMGVGVPMLVPVVVPEVVPMVMPVGAGAAMAVVVVPQDGLQAACKQRGGNTSRASRWAGLRCRTALNPASGHSRGTAGAQHGRARAPPTACTHHHQHVAGHARHGHNEHD